MSCRGCTGKSCVCWKRLHFFFFLGFISLWATFWKIYFNEVPLKCFLRKQRIPFTRLSNFWNQAQNFKTFQLNRFSKISPKPLEFYKIALFNTNQIFWNFSKYHLKLVRISNSPIFTKLNLNNLRFCKWGLYEINPQNLFGISKWILFRHYTRKCWNFASKSLFKEDPKTFYLCLFF